jgi:hypothetical protein
LSIAEARASPVDTRQEARTMRTHDVELEQLRSGVNCATLLERLSSGWMLDKRESIRRALKYRRDGEILIVNHDAGG